MFDKILQRIFKYLRHYIAAPVFPLFSALFILLPTTGSAEVLDRVVAVVNDEIITLSELEETGKEYLTRISETTPVESLEKTLAAARDNLLDKLIDQRLISQQAAVANVTISDTEFEKTYENNIQGMNLTRDSFLEQLHKAGLSEENYKANLRNQLLRDKLILYEVRSKIIITEEMITSFYDREYIKEIKGGGYHLLQMGFVWENQSNPSQSQEALEESKTQARQRAEKARRQVLDGADFAETARAQSDLPSAVDGGDLGLFQKNEMAAYMREAVAPLKAGDISPVFETPTAYQFFKLASNKEGDIVYRAPLETVKEEIRRKLFEEKFKEEFQNWVDKIKKDAYIKKML